MTISNKKHSELFEKDKLVYLTPDSDEPLMKIDSSKVYVISALVDETVQKNVTLNTAKEDGVNTARLPIEEFMKKAKGSYTFNQVLTTNQGIYSICLYNRIPTKDIYHTLVVFDILLNFAATQDWGEALRLGIPERKGFIPK